jgi:hypothetical protein
MVVVPDFGPAHPIKETLRIVRMDAVEAVSLLVIDADHFKAGVQIVPGRGFIGADTAKPSTMLDLLMMAFMFSLSLSLPCRFKATLVLLLYGRLRRRLAQSPSGMTSPEGDTAMRTLAPFFIANPCQTLSQPLCSMRTWE